VFGERSGPHVWFGTEGGAVWRLDPAAKRLDPIAESGDPPVTAIAASGGLVVVGRGEGSVEVGRPGAPLSLLGRLPSTVLFAAMEGPLVAASGGGVLVVWESGLLGSRVLLAEEAPPGPVAFLRSGSAGNVGLATWDPTRRVLRVVTLDASPRAADLDLGASPGGDDPSRTWTVADVLALRSGPPEVRGWSDLLIVVPDAGGLRSVQVTEVPTGPSGR
jgi:hypothetical protein